MIDGGIGHVNIVVNDLEGASAFFVKNFGWTAGEPMDLDGEWVQKLTGYPNATARYIPLTPPEGSSSTTHFELLTYINPTSPPPADSIDELNALGYRHLGFDVDDIQAEYDKLSSESWEFLSEPVLVAEMHLKTVYFKGPENILLQLTEKLPVPATVSGGERTVAADAPKAPSKKAPEHAG